MPLLTQHCWHLSELLWPTADWGAADSGYRGDGERGASCAAETLPLTMRGSGCGRRRLRLDRVTQLPALPLVWRSGDVMGWMNRVRQFGGEKMLTQLRWSKVKGNGNEPSAAFGEMLAFILSPRGQMFIFILWKDNIWKRKKRKKRNSKCFIEQRHTSACMLTPGGQCCCYAGPQDKKPSFHVSPEEGKTTTAGNKKRLPLCGIKWKWNQTTEQKQTRIISLTSFGS